jgi:hypothetical protein
MFGYFDSRNKNSALKLLSKISSCMFRIIEARRFMMLCECSAQRDWRHSFCIDVAVFCAYQKGSRTPTCASSIIWVSRRLTYYSRSYGFCILLYPSKKADCFTEGRCFSIILPIRHTLDSHGSCVCSKTRKALPTPSVSVNLEYIGSCRTPLTLKDVKNEIEFWDFL